MLPPVLELYVVWHPGDNKGAQVANEFFEHFHGSAFTGSSGRPSRFSFVAKTGTRMTTRQGPFRLTRTLFRMELSLPSS